ncbi:hypothetical protein S7711_11474 [Stachybotrys chartarum IBT 7711]|uniref:Uncharacterized protein n=1 Tax=Stachybotrys chartarum (strain CBS 109288 / IBT 7711) TaxID=1280523 RepID=A0A084B2X4_STACB|nr:hypothetical protein S7711_11474 [Stachybotrys chartarum IBT 7711]KFA45393.1 hypothetical protein S40293_11475 [Stachybotrys chartarum IBT 40293]
MEIAATPLHTGDHKAKVRILLQTLTHLVPGEDRGEKLDFIENLIAQHHWKRDFDRDQERLFLYHDDFGLDNIRCYFLIDHHGYDHTVEEEIVPVLWYKWTGQSLIRINEELPSKVQRKLRKWPFTWEGRKFHRELPSGEHGDYTPIDLREIIMMNLHRGVPILQEDRDFLWNYPDHAQWLKDHLKHELWIKIESFCNLPGGME